MRKGRNSNLYPPNHPIHGILPTPPTNLSPIEQHAVSITSGNTQTENSSELTQRSRKSRTGKISNYENKAMETKHKGSLGSNHDCTILSPGASYPSSTIIRITFGSSLIFMPAASSINSELDHLDGYIFSTARTHNRTRTFSSIKINSLFKIKLKKKMMTMNNEERIE